MKLTMFPPSVTSHELGVAHAERFPAAFERGSDRDPSVPRPMRSSLGEGVS